jgi:hypothetical protein
VSKLSRSVLKGIIKECMVEIMQESFFPHSNSEMIDMLGESKSRSIDSQSYKKNMREGNQAKKRSRHLDNINYGGKESSRKPNKQFENKVSNLASSMTSDPILADIFKDTAMTTLQEQVSADNKNPRLASTMPIKGGDRAAMAVSQNDPTDIFGAEAANKWASLAFADNVKK